MHWHIVIEASSKSKVERTVRLAPIPSRITILAEKATRLRNGAAILGIPVVYVDSVESSMRAIKPSPGELLVYVPGWCDIDSSIFTEASELSDIGILTLGVLDTSGQKHYLASDILGTAILGTGSAVIEAKRAFVLGNAISPSPHVSSPPIKLNKLEQAQPKSKDVHRERLEINPETFLDIALLRSPDVSLVPWRYSCEYQLASRDQNDRNARDSKAHWIAIHWKNGVWSWPVVLRVLCGRIDRDIIVFPGLILINPGSLRRLPPLEDMSTWAQLSIESGARVSVYDISGCSIAEHGNIPSSMKSSKRLRVAVMSMCGVTSFEDRYGLGGEHQVVHWLKEGFDAHPDVEHCDIFDTVNGDLAPNDYYDLVLSNSCWRTPPRVRPGGTSIFWHFNTNAFAGNEDFASKLGYNCIWTNSPSSLRVFRKLGVRCSFKHLNASTLHHIPYRWESDLFKHDACYVGGYQTEYKGKALIDAYVKHLCGHEFDFAIYGNRKWRAAVQREALKTDRSFKPECYDESFEPHYKHVLHPDDFTILAKNCPIWINFNAEDQRPLGMVNDRPIWGMACGAFFITDDTSEQRALYGDTCEYSTGGDDLLQKVRYWLSRPTERLERARAARENILKRRLHTHATVDAAIQQHLHGVHPNDSAC